MSVIVLPSGGGAAVRCLSIWPWAYLFVLGRLVGLGLEALSLGLLLRGLGLQAPPPCIDLEFI